MRGLATVPLFWWNGRVTLGGEALGSVGSRLRQRRIARLWGWPRWAALPLRLSLIVGLWVAMLAVALVLEPPRAVEVLARAGHVVALAVALGAILVVDWHGLLWLAGRRSVTDVLRVSAATGPLVWTGLAGLCATGPLLVPDLGATPARVKMLLVLGAAVNGALLPLTTAHLRDVPVETVIRQLPRAVRRRMVQATVVSQLCWWGAVAVGLWTTASRHY